MHRKARLDGPFPTAPEGAVPIGVGGSDFVGRDDLLDSAERWIASALASRGRPILLAGEAGIG